MNKADLVQEIKELIVTTLELEDIAPAEINAAEPLFVEGLGLDSIDALELGMALRKKYQVHFDSKDTENKKYFASVNSLAEFIALNGNVTLED